jgi:hypothetical protein
LEHPFLLFEASLLPSIQKQMRRARNGFRVLGIDKAAALQPSHTKLLSTLATKHPFHPEDRRLLSKEMAISEGRAINQEENYKAERTTIKEIIIKVRRTEEKG